MKDSTIPDDMISAAYYYSGTFNTFEPHKARLDGPLCWSAYFTNTAWIQVNFDGVDVYVTGLVTQGGIEPDNANAEAWVTKYMVSYNLNSYNDNTWEVVKDGDMEDVSFL